MATNSGPYDLCNHPVDLSRESDGLVDRQRRTRIT